MKGFKLKYIFSYFVALMVGILIAKGLYRGEIEMLIVAAVLFVGMIVYVFLRKNFVFSFVLVCLFLVGNGFYFWGVKSFDVPNYTQPTNVVGRVTDQIADYDYGYRVVLDDVKIDSHASGNKICLYISNCTGQIEAGDVLSFEGELTKENPFILKDFNSFAYRNGVRYSSNVVYSDLTISKGSVKFDEKVRLSVKSLLYEHLTNKNAGTAYAILFGDKLNLDLNIKNAFSGTGIIHLLTVSGLHIGFLVALFFTFLRKIKVNKYLCASLTTILIIFYLYICSFTPSVTRAGIMAIVFIFAKTFKKNYNSVSALGLAGFIICLLMPLAPFDIGFEMSFFSVLAIVTLTPIFQRFFNKFLPYKISSLLSLSFAAQFGVFPFLAKLGGRVHLLSFMLNMFLVPLFSVFFPFLFVVSFLGSFMRFLGYLLYPLNFVFDLIYIVVNFFNHSNLTLPVPAEYFGLIILVLLLIFGLSGLLKGYLKKFASFMTLVLITVVSMGIYTLPSGTPSVSYISSGSGYSLVFTSSKNNKLLVGIDKNIERFNKNIDGGGYDCVLTLSSPKDYQMNYLDSLNYKSIVSYQNPNQNEKIDVVPCNANLTISDFSFSFVENDGNVLGIFIVMDNQKFFVATELFDCYNLYYQVLEYLQPQVVFAGRMEKLAESGQYFTVTQNNAQGAKYSYEDMGNMILRLNDNGLVGRCLD